ncbi:MAG: hypothetical protein HY057_00460 [Rhodospirillales bacterium]|nr:hypothetical protein [Rhodospirillales bacterium]
MFARDPIFVVGDTLVVGRLQMELRQKEIRGLHWIIAKAKRQGTKVAQLNDPAAFLEGGDVIVDWPRVYVGIGKYASNRQGAAWLQGVLGSEAEVIPVALSDPGILHLDCCMTLIGPRRGIIHRPSLRHPLPAPLGEYDFIEIDGRTRRELGSNVLVLDPGAIALQARHAALAAALAQKRYEVIPLGFTFHAGLGGAFRCATAPLRRASA